MSYIVRTYSCDEGHEFTTGDTLPECPECSSTKVTWIPSNGHGGILKVSPGNDKMMKGLADSYGLTNMNSNGRGERAMPRSSPPVSATGPMYEAAPGFKAPLDIGPGGMPIASCKPCGLTVPIQRAGGFQKSNFSGKLPGTDVVAKYKSQ